MHEYERLAPQALDSPSYTDGGMLAVLRVSLVRMTCVAAETGARMQRDGLSSGPLAWVVSSLPLIGGFAPNRSIVEREDCPESILFRSLALVQILDVLGVELALLRLQRP